MDPTKKRTSTRPGLRGAAAGNEGPEAAARARAARGELVTVEVDTRAAARNDRNESASRPPAPSSRRPEPPASSPVPSRVTPRSVRSARPSLRVDDVGAAVKSGADAMGRALRQVPRVVRTRAEISEAPIDHRTGFLLAHIDGSTTVQGLVDIAGMPERDVHEILERLQRLGIVAVR